MNPKEYESAVADHFRKKGFEVELKGGTNDFGVDILAVKDSKRIAIQAKMFGKGRRKINHEMVLYLQGAKDYFGCDEAVLATDSELLPDAASVAAKLGIEVLFLDPATFNQDARNGRSSLFDQIWEHDIMPLQGKTLRTEKGTENRILTVDWSCLERVTSGGITQKIRIEIFQKVVSELEIRGEVTRDWINQQYQGRASSGICLVLSQSKLIRYWKNPARLVLDDSNK